MYLYPITPLTMDTKLHPQRTVRQTASTGSNAPLNGSVQPWVFFCIPSIPFPPPSHSSEACLVCSLIAGVYTGTMDQREADQHWMDYLPINYSSPIYQVQHILKIRSRLTEKGVHDWMHLVFKLFFVF